MTCGLGNIKAFRSLHLIDVNMESKARCRLTEWRIDYIEHTNFNFGL